MPDGQQLKEQIVQVLAHLFHREAETRSLLEIAGIPPDKVLPWGNLSAWDYWWSCLSSVEAGVIPPARLAGCPVPDGVVAILLAARKRLPSNTDLSALVDRRAEHLGLSWSDNVSGCGGIEEENVLPDPSTKPAGPNPFVWRSGITEAEALFHRDQELNRIRQFVGKRQNCQIVGPRRIGKTSLLRQVERCAGTWATDLVVAYLDLQSPQCFTLAGWLRRVGKQLSYPGSPADLVEFAEGVEVLLQQNRRLVLCLDEFEELAQRRNQFTRDFFLTLRSCGQMGLSIVTASQQPLSKLTDTADPVSPFYNTFPLMPLGPFALGEAADFIARKRPEVPPFTREEQAGILSFANGHPLALQVACFHVLEAGRPGGSVTAALRAAGEEMNVLLPGWSGGAP
jgi:hypothetical protein